MHVREDKCGLITSQGRLRSVDEEEWGDEAEIGVECSKNHCMNTLCDRSSLVDR